jgi:predicted PurR-regulated permease PerM
MPLPGNREIVRLLSVALAFAAAVLLFLWLFSKLYPILIFVAIAGVLSLVVRPVTDWLNDRRVGRWQMPRVLAALLSLLLIYAVLLGIPAAFSPLVVQQAEALSQIKPTEVIEALQEPLARAEETLARYGIPAQSLQEELQHWLGRVAELISLSSLFSGTVGAVSNLAVGFFAVTFTTFFMLRERRLFSRAVLAATPEPHMARMRKVLKSSRRMLRRYILGLLLQAAVFATVSSIGLTIVGVKYALLIGVFGALMNIIPYLGPILAGAFAISMAITGNIGEPFDTVLLPLSAKVFLVYWISQILDNNVFQPTIFANVVSAHPLEIFLVVMAAGFLAGIPGMIVAIPSYTILRILAREFLSEYKVVQALTGSMDG